MWFNKYSACKALQPRAGLQEGVRVTDLPGVAGFPISRAAASGVGRSSPGGATGRHLPAPWPGHAWLRTVWHPPPAGRSAARRARAEAHGDAGAFWSGNRPTDRRRRCPPSWRTGGHQSSHHPLHPPLSPQTTRSPAQCAVGPPSGEPPARRPATQPVRSAQINEIPGISLLL